MQWGFRGYSGGYRYTMGFSGPTSSLCSNLLKKIAPAVSSTELCQSWATAGFPVFCALLWA